MVKKYKYTLIAEEGFLERNPNVEIISMKEVKERKKRRKLKRIGV